MKPVAGWYAVIVLGALCSWSACTKPAEPVIHDEREDAAWVAALQESVPIPGDIYATAHARAKKQINAQNVRERLTTLERKVARELEKYR